MEQNFTTVNGYRVRYIEAGDPGKKHILCLHGLGASAERWSRALPILGKEYHVVAPDLVGFGYSDKPEVHYTMDFFVNFVSKFTDRLKMSNPTLIGASLGGHIAVETGLLHSRMLDKLILVSPAGILKEPTPALNHYIAAAMYPTYENAKKAFEEMAGSTSVDETYTRDFVNRMQLPNSKYAFMSAVLGSKSAPTLEGRLQKIRAPTLLVWGDRDSLMPVDLAARFQQGIAGSKLVVMKGCGHTPYFEKPDKFCDLVLEFLRN
jgi:pimeloyl-ACP methyl ester carboxylesterase